MKKDSFSGLSWITEEIRNEINLRDKIVKEEDIEKLFSLNDNSDFSIALYEILVKRNKKKTNSLNEIELNLFLCMNLENAGQADSILTFLQEWFPKHNEKTIKSLNEIGATKSSEIIKKAIELLPENGSWFFDSSFGDLSSTTDVRWTVWLAALLYHFRFPSAVQVNSK